METQIRFLSPPQVGRLLSTGNDQVLGWIRSGELKAVNLSRSRRPRWKINPADLARFLEARSNQTVPKRNSPRAIPKPTKEYV